jgi:DNA mismatch repair protein MutL
MFSLSPTLDFDRETSFDTLPPRGYEPKPPAITINPDYNPFQTQPVYQRPDSGLTANRTGWEKLYEGFKKTEQKDGNQIFTKTEPSGQGNTPDIDNAMPQLTESQAHNRLLQVQNRFILTNVKSGLLLVDQQKAMERILFERITDSKEELLNSRQRLLFPQSFQFSPVDTAILLAILPDLESLGFEISDMGNGVFAVNTTPAEISSGNVKEFIDSMLEDFKKSRLDSREEQRIKLARIITGRLAVRRLKTLRPEEMQQIIDELFACQIPEIAPDGSRILKIIELQELEKFLKG